MHSSYPRSRQQTSTQSTKECQSRWNYSRELSTSILGSSTPLDETQLHWRDFGKHTKLDNFPDGDAVYCFCATSFPVVPCSLSSKSKVMLFPSAETVI